MVEWNDEGLVLAARPHGETASVVSILTRRHGRHAGLVLGGQSRKTAAILQPGQQVDANWRARLPDQLGHFAVEPLAPYPARILENPMALAALTSACAVADAALPERENYSAVYEGLLALIDVLPTAAGTYAYVRWELGLLRELGFAVDLSSCAVTGLVDSPSSPLTHVSPKTGRAVCAQAAADYQEKLLPLPAFLCGRGEPSPDALRDGFKLTGFFLERCVFAMRHQPLPQARARLIARLEQAMPVAA